MFIVTNSGNFNIDNFNADIDNAIKNLNVSTNIYYNKWTVDVSNYINPAPETNLNYSGYLFQKQRSRLLSQFKFIFSKFIYNELQPDDKFLTYDELWFLIKQPEIKQLFDKYSITINRPDKSFELLFPTCL